MTAVQLTPVIPAHPNLVELAALLEDPHLQAPQRTALRQVLHDTVHLVKKQDGSVRETDETATGQTRTKP